MSTGSGRSRPSSAYEENTVIFENDFVILLRSAFWYPRFYYPLFRDFRQSQQICPIRFTASSNTVSSSRFCEPDVCTRLAIHQELSSIIRQWWIFPWTVHILALFSTEFAGAVLIPHIIFGPWGRRNPAIDHIVVPMVILLIAFFYITVQWWINARNRHTDNLARDACQVLTTSTTAANYQIIFGFLEPAINRKWHATYVSDISTRLLILRNTTVTASIGDNGGARLSPRSNPTAHIPFWIKMLEPIGCLIGCLVGFGAGIALLDSKGPL